MLVTGLDIDHPDAALRALSAQGSHPLPTAIVENRRNGHAHAVWALAEPVTRTEYASRKATAYAAAVVEGLRRAVDGDSGYSGLLTKNPVHDDWRATWLGDDLRSLKQLEEDLGRHMPPERWRRNREPVGLGRNCAIFETALHWAYREVRHHFGDPQGLADAIHGQVHSLNVQFAEPLHPSEATQIAASIHRWITTKSRMWSDGAATYEATFITIQSARARKTAGKERPARSGWREQLREDVL